MKTLTLVLLALISTSPMALAEVRESKQMQEILPLLAEDTWIVFDIDNTVLEPVQTLGSDQWFEYMVKKLGNVDAAIDIWMKVQKKTEMQTVEPTTPHLIRQLQRLNYKVFALTARPAELDAVTRKQLRLAGVTFEKIISIGPGLNKGKMLSDELRSGRIPRRVLFIDDKEKHVHSVDQALDSFSLEHYEFRYGAADPKVKAFSPEIAEVQLSYFEKTGRILSDEEASR